MVLKKQKNKELKPGRDAWMLVDGKQGSVPTKGEVVLVPMPPHLNNCLGNPIFYLNTQEVALETDIM